MRAVLMVYLSGPAMERIDKSSIERVIILDTIPVDEENCSEKIEILSVAPIFAEAIRRIYEDIAVSIIFDDASV